MNSGMRLSVTIIVLVVIALGLYYASLDDDRGGVKEPATPATTAEPGESPIPTDGGPASIIEATPPATTVAEDAPTPIREPAEPAEDLGTLPATDDGGSSESVSTDEGLEDDSSSFEGEGGNESLEPATDDRPASDEAVGGGLEPAEPESPITEVVETDLATEDPDAVTDAVDQDLLGGADPDVDSDPDLGADELDASSDRASDEPRLPGRSVAEAGLGGHVIVSENDSFEILTSAFSALADADPTLVIVPAGEGLAWLAIPASLRDSKFLETAVISNNDETGVDFMLVREDRKGSLALGGRIAEAQSAGLPGGERFRVRYRVRQDLLDSVRHDSSVLIGQPVAWVVDGGVVGISKPRITISQRSVLPISVDEATASRLAMEIMRSTNDEATDRPAPAVEASATGDADGAAARPTRQATAAGTGRPARAGELAADQYTIYIIKPSDTPSSIALEWFGDANKYSLILRANPLIDPKLMMPGDEIRLPPNDYELRTIIDVGDGDEPVIHIVQSGENLSGIALAAYGDASLWPRIYEANKSKIKDPSRLTVGTELVIP